MGDAHDPLSPDTLCRGESTASAYWLGGDGGGVQDLGHVAAEAFGMRWRHTGACPQVPESGHPDASRLDTK